MATRVESSASPRPTSWWLRMLQKRAERMHDEKLDVPERIVLNSETELERAQKVVAYPVLRDPKLPENLRFRGNEEGPHRLDRPYAVIGSRLSRATYGSRARSRTSRRDILLSSNE